MRAKMSLSEPHRLLCCIAGRLMTNPSEESLIEHEVNHLVHGSRSVRIEGLLSDRALAEARAILAETETENGCMPLHCFNGRLALVRYETDFMGPVAALADALRAFIGE